MNELKFYTRPFRECKYSGWVYDAKGNFVFEFEGDYDEKGNYKHGYVKLTESIILKLNDVNFNPLKDFKLELKNEIELHRNGKLFILIRGWGNLTGIGSHNFTSEKASKIQDDFVKYLLHKLCSQ